MKIKPVDIGRRSRPTPHPETFKNKTFSKDLHIHL